MPMVEPIPTGISKVLDVSPNRLTDELDVVSLETSNSPRALGDIRVDHFMGRRLDDLDHGGDLLVIFDAAQLDYRVIDFGLGGHYCSKQHCSWIALGGLGFLRRMLLPVPRIYASRGEVPI